MTTFSCNKLNLCFDPLLVARFWSFLSFWKAGDIRKQIAQILQRNIFKISAYNKGFFKNIYFILLWTIFLQKCLLYNWILQNNNNFCKFANFLKILKVEHKSFPMMYHLPYLNIKHGIIWSAHTELRVLRSHDTRVTD